MNNFVEETVARYSPDDFTSHFRMSREKVEEVTVIFGRDFSPRQLIPPLHQVLLSLWLLANHVSFRSVADRFDVTKSCAWSMFMEFCTTCAKRANEFITWPVNTVQVMAGFRDMAGFPGVVGCVDGIHIPILMPSDRGYQYINRKGFPSINMLAVCDNNMRFTWVNVGWPGSVHDARIYRNELEPLLMGAGRNELLGVDGHLLGDAAFPLSSHMLVPFRDNGHLGERKVYYNSKLSSTRMTIERTFGRFKGKFRRMKNLDMLRVDLIPNVILAACVLHNVSMEEEQEENPAEHPEEQVEALDHDEGVEEPGDQQDEQDGNGAQKRDEMVERLWAYRRGRMQ